jgi:hypothetical protein
MNRSVTQIAASYAPERHFAFESGLGVCIARSADVSELKLEEATRKQIMSRVQEATRDWFAKGSQLLMNSSPEREVSLRHMTVDTSLYSTDNQRFEFRPDDFCCVAPSRMDYVPSPTTLICSTCGLIVPCDHETAMLKFLQSAENDCKDPKGRDPTKCEWRQFEPIFVHPSGSWRPVGTSIIDYDAQTEKIYKRRFSCEACGSDQFRVDTSSVSLGAWFLKCARCDVRHNLAWTDHDEDYLRLGGKPKVSLLDARMDKISYGAAVAYAVQAETFVEIPSEEALDFLDPTRDMGLKRLLAKLCSYPAPTPDPITAADELLRKGEAAREIGQRIKTLLEIVTMSGPTEATKLKELIDKALSEVRERQFLDASAELPIEIADKVAVRSQRWSSRYDPFRLCIEHEALKNAKLSGKLEDSRQSYLRFLAPDVQLAPWEKNSEEEKAALPKIERDLSALGVAEAGLIPKFRLCRVTFGYSRTSPTPTPGRPEKTTPVRLKLFPKITLEGDRHHPLYVLRQENEAFYFRLDEARVTAWLRSIGCEDETLLNAAPSLKAALLASAPPMDRFMSEHDKAAAERPPRPAKIYIATFALLHSFAHHVMRTMAKLSGLDESSLGEYLFPGDLAFVIYRSGMTMDLGDLSSLWRNAWEPFLNELCRYNESLACNVGSLCSEQGGACPDCLMIPETSCIGGNRYLSRSLLTGEGLPSFMTTVTQPLRGFLERP